MNKNFKKVISTVAALSMMASSFVAMAATYPDVTADNSYSSAIEQLSALGIIDGFEDGTFRPDEKVTRAQMAKLVVGAKNKLAAAESNTTVIFDDVDASHWALGYVAAAYADNKIINGTSATTFDPDASVTFAQATKMLVNACGYDAYAQQSGGWPSGYLSYGTKLKINSGVKNVGNDTELTRGQVAQMIANAIKAPILTVDGYYYDNGQMVPNYKEWNGEDYNTFKSLLTEEWDTYEVYGRVTGTAKSGAVKADEVYYQVEKSDNFNGMSNNYDYLPALPESAQKMSKGETKAEDHYLDYSYALVYVNDDDEATIKYIETTAKSEKIQFADELFSSIDLANDKIEIKKSETTSNTTSYKLSDDVILLVNGIEIDNADQDDFEAYLSAENYGVATLVDTPQNGEASTDGYYDYIAINVNSVAVVSEVYTKNEVSTIIFDDQTSDLSAGKIEIDPDEENFSYSIVDTEGKDVAIEELQENDVLSIAYDHNKTPENSAFLNIVVSRNVVEAKYNAKNKTDYTFGSDKYELVSGMVSDSDIDMGTSYQLFLTKDGKVAKVEVLATSLNYAIVDRIFDSAGDKKVRLILKDGSKVDYVLNTEKTNATLVSYLETLDGTNNSFLKGGDGSDAQDVNATALQRIVEYKVNSSEQVTLEATTDVDWKRDAYSERNSKIGNKIADAAVVLDASSYNGDRTNSVSVSSKDVLLDEVTYTAIFVGKKDSNSAYPMVVLLTGNSGYSVTTGIVVATGEAGTYMDDQNELYALEVLPASLAAEDNIKLVAETNVFSGVAEGDAFIYKTDSEGYVTEITPVLDMSAFVADPFANLGAQTVTLGEGYCDIEEGETVEYFLAPVYNKSSSMIDLAMSKTGVFTNVSAVTTDFSYAVDAKAYSYDDTNAEDYKTSVINTAGVMKSTVLKANINDTTDEITWNGTGNTVRFALIRVYKDDVQEVYSIVLD